MKTLQQILDDAACQPDGCERLRKMGNRWFDRAHRWKNGGPAYAIYQACNWRSLAIALRDFGQISDALRYERYSDDAVNDLRRTKGVAA